MKARQNIELNKNESRTLKGQNRVTSALMSIFNFVQHKKDALSFQKYDKQVLIPLGFRRDQSSLPADRRLFPSVVLDSREDHHMAVLLSISKDGFMIHGVNNCDFELFISQVNKEGYEEIK
ncbi:MAG: hypothetical protein WCJ19_01415 [bacterium]